MNSIDAALLKRGILAAYHKLDEMKDEVNRLNVFPVPDGDTGTNMSLTMKSAAAQISGVGENSVGAVGKALGTGSLMGARGNSGVILSQLCRGVSEALKGKTVFYTADVAYIFSKATEMAYKAVMKPTEGTILTVARMMSEYAEANSARHTEIEPFLEEIIEEGKRALARTPEMLIQLKEAGVVDAGGQGLIYLLTGFLEALTGKAKVEHVAAAPKSKAAVHAEPKLSEQDIKFGYCTEFFIMADGSDYLSFRDEIESMGDSIVCIGMDDVIKTHIHTNNPGKVLELAMKRGPLRDIKIDNMRLQHQHRLIEDAEYKKAKEEDKAHDAEKAPEAPAAPAEKKAYGFVSVSLGEGFDALFRDLMVDEIVSGGQTMNPSTQDLFEATERINAETVFIFPNNKNIILAAEQVQSLSDKRVIVVPTRSIPEGFTALFHFDETVDPDENLRLMKESLSTVTTGQITYSIRDTEIHGLEIHKDDLIGLINGDIVATGKDPEELVERLLEDHVTEDTALVTVYRGAGAEEEAFEKLLSRLERRFDEIDVEGEDGGQPTYYYIFSIE